MYSQSAERLTFSTTGKVNVAGNIMSLLSNSNFASIKILNLDNKWCFTYLFKNCSTLIDASNLILPATNINNATACYANMFYNCTNLIKAPVLPVKILKISLQYANMFYNCSSLFWIIGVGRPNFSRLSFSMRFYFLFFDRP